MKNSREIKDDLHFAIRKVIKDVMGIEVVDDDACYFWQDDKWLNHFNNLYGEFNRKVGTARSAAKDGLDDMHRRIDELVDTYKSAKGSAPVDETDHRSITEATVDLASILKRLDDLEGEQRRGRRCCCCCCRER